MRTYRITATVNNVSFSQNIPSKSRDSAKQIFKNKVLDQYRDASSYFRPDIEIKSVRLNYEA